MSFTVTPHDAYTTDRVFTVTVTPYEAYTSYRLTGPFGYRIDSSEDFSGQTKKIAAILSRFREHAIAKDNMIIRNEKFNRYVAWRPESEWNKIAEYQLYKPALERLTNAEHLLAEVMEKYHVISITPLE